ncbi:hypothetical protein [Pseudomonas syringae group sp. J248-6]|uniref:hypothetical protein n=1 Tax=Pseudomonas syringae group sp. J248-6 TaxID=3079590 RepID=UPI00290E0409|nr:hypothetical protein [Pseudomonas syringae group sp. J248-6]MDU8541395.1 hypothetical protein [Pseudomonas syringae group sp. J248-6]
MLEVIEDVIGINEAGLVCHPYKFQRGPKKGRFSFTLKSDNKSFEGIDEKTLRSLIEDGHFNETGRIFMVPAGCISVRHHAALNVRRYKGDLIPLVVK